MYTDGSTMPGDRPTAGWGWVQYEAGGSALGNRTGKGKGRLGGEQNNYKAEAWALLDALASIHPTTDASIYIDNYAVVQRWVGDKRGHTRGRSKGPARAVWNRPDAIKTARRVAGSETRVQWVHSQCHVEVTKGVPEGEPVGKKPKRAEGGVGKAIQGKQEAPRCACGEAGGRCGPDHVHNNSNDVADELANLGRIMPVPCT